MQNLFHSIDLFVCLFVCGVKIVCVNSIREVPNGCQLVFGRVTCVFRYDDISGGCFSIYRCPRRNVPEFGRVFLMLKYTDITQNTYVHS